MEKRLLLAIVLSFIILLGFQALFLKKPAENSAAAPAVSGEVKTTPAQVPATTPPAIARRMAPMRTARAMNAMRRRERGAGEALGRSDMARIIPYPSRRSSRAALDALPPAHYHPLQKGPCTSAAIAGA